MCIKAGAKVQKTEQRTKYIPIYFSFFRFSDIKGCNPPRSCSLLVNTYRVYYFLVRVAS